MQEPKIWSHITDQLPDSHYLAWEIVDCKSCGASLHSPNECMQTWVETGVGNFCLKCFASKCDQNGVLEDSYGIRETVKVGK